MRHATSRYSPSFPRQALLGGAALILGACASSGPEVSGVYEIDGYRVEQGIADHYGRGLENLELGRYGLALDDLRRALREDPGSVRVLNAIAFGYGRLGRHDIAVDYLRRALVHEPDSVQTLNNLARALLDQGRPEEALAWLSRIGDGAAGESVVLANLDAAADALAAQQDRGEPDGDGPGPEGAGDKGAPVAWIVRTTAYLQTLLTKASLGLDGAGTGAGDMTAWHAVAFTAPDQGAGPAGETLPGLRPAAADAGWPGLGTILPGVPWISVPQAATITVEPLPAPAAPMAEAGIDVVEVAEPGIRLPVGPPAPLADLFVEVANGTGQSRMAARMGRWLATRGLEGLVLTNDASFGHGASILFYRPGMRAAAERLAATLPVAVALEPSPGLYADLRLLLGADLLAFDRTLLLDQEEAG